jgi:hypothetical protein
MSEHETDRLELSERARGWLRFMYRKALVDDDWSKEGQPSAVWDATTVSPLLNWHRFDAIESTYAIALMSDVTPAWREVYSQILDRLAERCTSYWAAKDWIEQIGPDPDRDKYPDDYFPLLIPEELRGKYDKPGWAANGVEPWGYEPDPVKAAGAIYYKGFLDLVLGLHLYVSGDKKYNNGFDIVRNGKDTFHYTHSRLNEIIGQQWGGRVEGSH